MWKIRSSSHTFSKHLSSVSTKTWEDGNLNLFQKFQNRPVSDQGCQVQTRCCPHRKRSRELRSGDRSACSQSLLRWSIQSKVCHRCAAQNWAPIKEPPSRKLQTLSSLLDTSWVGGTCDYFFYFSSIWILRTNLESLFDDLLLLWLIVILIELGKSRFPMVVEYKDRLNHSPSERRRTID